MSSERFRRHEPCSHEGCAERNFYVGGDGYTYCRRGHQQTERGAVVAEDTGELIVVGRKHKRRAGSEAASISTTTSTPSAPQSLENLLLCLQLVLRKQIQWLITNQGLPSYLEAVVKDLWTLQIRELKPSVILDPDSDSESQHFSSQSESESIVDARRRSSRSSRRRNPLASHSSRPQTFNLIDLLGILYVGFLIVRAPVTLADLHDWTASGELLYYQSSREVPDSLRRRLPGSLQRILDPEIWLKPVELQRSAYNKMQFFTVVHGLDIPSINHSVLLFRWVRLLNMPLEVYTGADRLVRMLRFKLDYVSEGGPLASRMPEVMLMALVVVTIKLLFPLDADERHSSTANNLSALRMDWSEWNASMSRHDKSKQDQFEALFEATEEQVVKMTENDLDDYLDWYQQYIASENITELGVVGRDADFRRAIADMFPCKMSLEYESRANVVDRQSNISSDTLRGVQSQLTVRSLSDFVDRDSEDKTGHYYRIRTINELLTSGNEVAKQLYTVAAKTCAIELKHFVRAVLLVEKRLAQHEASITHAVRADEGAE